MVDKDARRRAAELLRHFVAGQITNDEFENRFPSQCNDAAVNELRSEAWYLYDDLRQYRLVGKDRLSPERRHDVGRWVLFLRTGLEYEWPVRSVANTLLLTVGSFCTFGVTGKLWKSRFSRYGEIEIWPFIRRSEYKTALANSLLLGRAV
jgi:hypothetical protein